MKIGLSPKASIVCAALVFLSIALGACSSNETVTTLSAEQRFEKAKVLFDNGDFLEAIQEFNIIILQYQGSSVAADAQFYLAECRFKRGEFLLASYEYQTLRRNMPSSPRVEEGMYKLGLCYYNLSPKSRLDQQYTKRAIDELQAFVDYYPKSALVPDAAAKIQELNTKLAKKDYDAARLYATMEYYKAAIAYYDNVIEKYHDTEFAPLSYLGKTELLIARKKYREAKAEITKFIEKFPHSVFRYQVDKLNEQIDSELKNTPPVSGKQSGESRSTPAEANLMQTRQ